MSPTTPQGEWISRDPAELTTQALLGDLLGYDDGFAGRGLRPDGAEEAIVAMWIRTPRGRELVHRLKGGQANLDPDPRHVPEDEPWFEQPNPRASCLALAIGGIVLVIVMAIALSLVVPRSGPDPTTPQPGVSDAAGLVRASASVTVGTSGPSQSGPPLASAPSSVVPKQDLASGAPSPSPAVASGATSEGPQGPTAPMSATT